MCYGEFYIAHGNQERAFGEPPEKGGSLLNSQDQFSVESLTFKRISLFQTEPDSACTKSPEGYWFVLGPGFCRLCGKLTAHFQILE
jgi:hypothetical protein